MARRQSLDLDARFELFDKPLMTGTELLQKWTGNIDKLLKALHDEYIRSAAAPPCGYAFIICGSGSRKEACPYSDLDCAMLIEADGASNVSYFRNMCKYIDEQLQALEEEGTNDPTTGFPVNGIRFCGGGLNPLGRRGKLQPRKLAFGGVTMPGFVELIRTPQAMAEAQENPDDKHISDGLLETRFCFGSSGKLHDAYREEVNTILGKREAHWSWRPLLKKRKLMALEMLTEVISKFQPPAANAEKWEIKTNFYRAPQFIAKSLAFWYSIDRIGTIEQVDALRQAGRLSVTNSQRILRVLNAVAAVRVLAHLEAGSEADIVWTWGNHAKRQNAQEKLLSQSETKSLQDVIPDLSELQRLTREFITEKKKAVGHRSNPFA